MTTKTYTEQLATKDPVYVPLPGEGDTRTEIRTRRYCEICGEPATVRVTYLMPNCRSNPHSTAYRHDDCSWCADSEAFACDEHKRAAEQDRPNGFGWAATFSLPRFAHMLLYWRQLSMRSCPGAAKDRITDVWYCPHGRDDFDDQGCCACIEEDERAAELLEDGRLDDGE